MSGFEVVILAFTLAIDAFVVSFSYGLCGKKSYKNALYLAWGTALFQFLMPLAGALLAGLFLSGLQNYATIVAGIIFIILGIKFLKENFDENELSLCEEKAEISVMQLLSLSVATSIDALAAGCSIYLTKSPVVRVALVIGCVTFCLSLTGFVIGVFFKKLAPNLLSKFGGIILILLGLKTIFL